MVVPCPAGSVRLSISNRHRNAANHFERQRAVGGLRRDPGAQSARKHFGHAAAVVLYLDGDCGAVGRQPGAHGDESARHAAGAVTDVAQSVADSVLTAHATSWPSTVIVAGRFSSRITVSVTSTAFACDDMMSPIKRNTSPSFVGARRRGIAPAATASSGT
jgi:hypothetical protein